MQTAIFKINFMAQIMHGKMVAATIIFMLLTFPMKTVIFTHVKRYYFFASFMDEQNF